MNKTAHFHVTGTPAPQPRPRMTKRGHTYNPPSADAWKAAVRTAWRESGNPPFARHIRMRLEFFLARPAGHLTKRGALVKGAPAHPVGRPDVDNLAKAVMDALGDEKAFPNDAAVISLSASKAYADFAGCRITITERD
ncbi:MAG: RusA family crossover junction endodeoxyribonuclease [Verrucomicrobiota bacterium]